MTHPVDRDRGSRGVALVVVLWGLVVIAIVTVRAEARTVASGIFVRKAIVRAVGRPEAPYEILAWKQGARRSPEPE